jgi:hypothetical protein
MKNTFFLLFYFFSLCAYSQLDKKVLIIGIDGCRPDALNIASTPSIDLLIGNGVFSSDALNDDITISGPGWSAIICGVWSDKHLVTNNNFDGNNYEEYPSIFQYIESFNSDLNTASICHWAPINDYIVDDTADFTLNVSNDSAVSSEAIDYITENDVDVLFLHFDDVDYAGHAYGFSPEVDEYIDAIEGVDLLIGPIITSIENRPNYDNEDWLIIVSTDHGGKNISHGGSSLEEENVFFIASGNSVETEVIEKEIIIVAPPFNCLAENLELQFDGDNDYVSIEQNPLFDFGENRDFTIECRVRTNSGGDVVLVGNKDWNSGFNPGFVISFELPEGELWKVNIGDGANRVDINTGGNILDNEWHTLSVSFDRDDVMKIFLDGNFIEEASIANIGNIDVGEGIFLGADYNSAYEFQGALAEVRIWDNVINASEIGNWYCQSLDNSHPNYNQLLGYWKLNDNLGNTAVDSSVNSNNGIIEGAEWNAPNTEEYDFSNTPRIVDVPYTALTHLCIEIADEWYLDGKNWISDCNIATVNTNLLKSSVTIYPNPVDSNLKIDLNELDSNNRIKIEILTIKGKKIFQKKLSILDNSIDLSDLSSGIYFLKITVNNSSILKKVVKI